MARRARRRTRSIQVQAVVVAIDSSYEPVTRAAREYRDRVVYPYIESKGFEIRRFQGNLARRVYVAPAASDAAVDYLTGVGHGLEDLYTGDYGDPIFQVGSYDSREVNPKIAHFLSCQTAARLGPDFVRNGCKAYFGYDVNFAFTFEQKDLFFECDSEIDRALADGLNAGQTYRRVRKLYETRITELRQAGKFYVASILENDLEHLRSPADGRNWGATSARLS